MQLEDIEEEGKESLWTRLSKANSNNDKQTENHNSSLSPSSNSTEPRTNETRRGSHLLAAAGIDFEKRRKRGPSTTSETRIYRDGSQWVEEKDGKVTKLEIVEINEKMGRMRRSVPTLPVPIALLLCFINLVLPGIGTFIGAGTLLCGAKCRHEKVSTGIKYAVFAGIIQILLAPLLVGWIYSIYYGMNIVQDSMTKAAIKPDESTQQKEESPSNEKALKDQLTVQAWA